MKKIFVIAMALMMVAGMAYAEDRLSLNGSFFIRGWDQEGYSGKYAPSYKEGSANEASWWEQRFRLGGKIAVADDVSVNFRMDIGEGVWGLDYNPGSVARPGVNNPSRLNTKLDVDRAFLKIDKGMWNLTAGQQYMGLGVTQVFDVNATGFNLGFNFEPIKVSLLYARFDENGSTQDDGATDDVDRYGLNVGYAADTWGAKLFAIMGTDGTKPENFPGAVAKAEDSPFAVGLNGNATFGMFNLQGELAFLGGDFKTKDAAGTTTTIDYIGTQLFIGADAQITEMIKLGVEGFWAAGTDDAKERQLTNLGDWDTFTPMGYNTPLSGFVTGMPSWDVMDPFGISGGVVGGTFFFDLAIIEPLSLGGKVGYFTPSEDKNQPGAKLLAYNLWIKYMIATNTYLTGTYLVSDPEADDATIYQTEAKAAVAELTISF